MKYIIKNLEQLDRFAGFLASTLEKSDVISLVGDLGAGKTTLVQMVGKHLGIDDYITSPTFSLVNIYESDMPFYHLDLYRMDDPDELLGLDFETYFYPDGITFIEWAEKGADYIPEDIIEIRINVSENHRLIEIVENSKRAKEIKGGIDENFGN
ncbi:MAG: tRNA (adenosine(37)-N6)-threonylcarbamoyltransferase complex ATPase subunit type 1 TsaE [Tissierellia bacterium]|nr:tRNA (adenosine(37)-N6)-threonylcarbamoyltransferase complex ATPase subunit type 1 TsaE [Tissierellia bacterium]